MTVSKAERKVSRTNGRTRLPGPHEWVTLRDKGPRGGEREQANPFVTRPSSEQIADECRAAFVNETDNLRKKKVSGLGTAVGEGRTDRNGREQRERVLGNPVTPDQTCLVNRGEV